MSKQLLELNLSEDNELGLSVSIVGSDSEIGSSKPKIRFVVTETKTGKGWVFNAEKPEDGSGVLVTIPNMKGVVSEENDYEGKLEVILGTRYFTPTEVDIKFIEPLKVEAAIVTKSSKQTESLNEEVETVEPETIKEELSVESEIESVVVVKESAAAKQKEIEPEPIQEEISEEVVEEKPVVKESKKSTVSSYSDLDDETKKKVNQVFFEKCRKIDPKAFKTENDVRKYMKEGTTYTKKRLKALIAQSINECIEE